MVLAGLLAFAAVGGAPTPAETPASSIEAAQRLFYNGSYDAAAAMTLALRTADPGHLAAYELRTSALHFQIRHLIGDAKDKDKAFKQCAPCAGLLTTFHDELTRGLAVARARLRERPDDDVALFYLGKLDLNHVWLFLGTLGRRTAWGEYKEARRSMEAVLKRDPTHVRARVAHAWIEYIVDTRVPFGFQWMLGGGDRKRALATTRQAANANADFFTRTEARFALWEMLIREKQIDEARTIARALLVDFPTNRDLLKFLGT
jgi:tetratricopeptide (TPR) repeat protein